MGRRGSSAAASSAIAPPPAADEDRPSVGAKQATEGSCRRCNAVIGEFFNQFQRVSDSYYLPSLLGSYHSKLVPAYSLATKPKPASPNTELSGCLIRPLVCPQCRNTLGFFVDSTPDEKEEYRGRDFFKLSRIILTCKVGPDSGVVVEPYVDKTRNTRSPEATRGPTEEPRIIPSAEEPQRASSATLAAGEMEVARHVGERREHTGQVQHFEKHAQSLPPPSVVSDPSRPMEASRQSLPPLRQDAAAQPQNGVAQKAFAHPTPTASPAMRPVQDVQLAPLNQSPGMPHQSRELPPIDPSRQQPQPQPNGHNAMSSESVHEIIGRMQAQISLDAAATQSLSRELRSVRDEMSRLSTSVLGLKDDFRRITGGYARLHRDVYELQTNALGSSVDDGVSGSEALELVNQRLDKVAKKADEVETLNITIKILKDQIKRLENPNGVASTQPAPAGQAPGPYGAPQVTLPHGAPTVRSNAPPTVPSNVHSTLYPNAPQSLSDTPPFPEERRLDRPYGIGPHVEPNPREEPPQTGWSTVNAPPKRPRSTDYDSGNDLSTQHPAKRPTLEGVQTVPYAGSQIPSARSHEYRNPEDSESRTQTQAQSPHPYSLESLNSTNNTLLTKSAYPPYPSQDAPSDDSWRAEPQRVPLEHPGETRTPATRGRPRGRGRGARNATRASYETPQQERDTWSAYADSQASPDYYSIPAHSGRGTARRGGGGGGPIGTPYGSRESSVHASHIYSIQGVTPGPSISLDHMSTGSSSKKTRTKPTRNADGVLIRKDGQPDKRSQSSAMNLRKIHEAREAMGRDGSLKSEGQTPPSVSGGTAQRENPETPSPTTFLLHGQEVTDSVKAKHKSNLEKIFPGGVEAVTRDAELMRKAFGEEADHASHARRTHQQRTTPAEPGAAKAKSKTACNGVSAVSASQSPKQGDVEMAETQSSQQTQTAPASPSPTSNSERAEASEQPRSRDEEMQESARESVAQDGTPETQGEAGQ